MKQPSCSQKGRMAEDIVRVFLEDHGMIVLGCRQRTPVGELDIVGREGREAVFVEVKARCGGRMGSGEESLDRRRVHRMLAAAAYWLGACSLVGTVGCRFDLVVVELDSMSQPLRLVRHKAWIE